MQVHQCPLFVLCCWVSDVGGQLVDSEKGGRPRTCDSVEQRPHQLLVLHDQAAVPPFSS